MKTDLSRLKEETFETSKNPRFVMQLFHSTHDRNYEKGVLAHVVYVDGDVKSLINGCLFKGTKKDIKRNFMDELLWFIKKCNPGSIFDFVLFNSLFCTVRGTPTIKNILDYNFRGCEVVNDILADSRGLLLWDYQLESLCGLFCDIPKFAVNMARGLNIRDPRSEDIAKKHKFNKDLSLYDVVSERMVMDVTCRPDFKGAYNLYRVVMDI